MTLKPKNICVMKISIKLYSVKVNTKVKLLIFLQWFGNFSSLEKNPQRPQSRDCKLHFSPAIGSPSLLKILIVRSANPRAAMLPLEILGHAQVTVSFLFISACQHED